jgi:uncharacterized protein YeaO (DUF488 family)
MAIRRRRRLRRADDEELAGSFSSPACYLHEFEAASRVSAHGRARGIAIKRIYDAPESADGYRVLVDRLWPRGVSKQRAALDAWLVNLAPSTALRASFHHDPIRWPEFARRYRAELRAQAALLRTLRQRARRQRVTLLYAARDAQLNNATVLREVLRGRAPQAATRRDAGRARKATRERNLPRTLSRRRP